MSALMETLPGATTDSNATSLCRSKSTTAAGYSPQTFVSSAQVEQLRQKLSSLILYQPDLQDLLSLSAESNSWTVEEALQRPHTITTIELFLIQVPRMPLLQCFPYLVTVKFMSIGLESMADLASLTHVEELWLSENNIRVIEGLDNMTRLRRLYLQTNRIESLHGLPPLRHLRELWLSRNRLTALTHLTPLRKLRVLYVSGNPLENLDNAFSKNMSHLNEVNLSGCHLSSITDLHHLQQLSCLRNLWLLDPLFGDNPICRLHNYETLTLSILDSLDSLDGSFVTQEQRSLVESVMHKKQSYYAMRAQMLDTQVTLLSRHAEACALRHNKDYSKALFELRSCLQPVEHELAERILYNPDSKHSGGIRSLSKVTSEINMIKSDFSGATLPVPTATLEELSRKLSRAIDTCEVQGHTVMLNLAEVTQEAKAQSQVLKERLAVELHTAGNVRLENIPPDHETYAVTAEMIRERFDKRLFSDRFGIEAVEVTCVRRIINRGLRLRFDDRVKELHVDLANPQLRNRFVGLFGIVPVTSQSQSACLQHILMCGAAARSSAFSEDNKKMGGLPSVDSVLYRPVPAEEGVPLTNNLFYADEERLLSCRASTGGAMHHAGTSSIGGGPGTLCRGQVVLYRVYLGKTVHALGGGGAANSTSIPVSFLQQNGRVRRKDYSTDTCAAYRLLPSTPTTGPVGDSNSSSSQPLPSSYVWYCFDRALLLPDCVVDYMYTMNEAPFMRTPKTTAVPGSMRPKLSRASVLALLNGLPPLPEWWEVKNAEVDDTHGGRKRTDGIEDVFRSCEGLLEFIFWCGPPNKYTRTRGTASVRNTLQQVAEIESNSALASVQKELGKDCMVRLLGNATVDENVSGSEHNRNDAGDCNMNNPLQARHIEEYAVQMGADKTSLTLCVLRSKGITAVLQDFSSPLCACITTLDLAHNRLASLSWFALSKEAPHLQRLNLSGNVLSYLHLDGSSFPSLRILDVSDNRLESVADFASIRSVAAALEELFVHGNPFLWHADGQEAEARLWMYLLPPPTSMKSTGSGIKPAIVKLNTHLLDTYPGTLAAKRYRRGCLLPGGRATSRTSCIIARILQCVQRDEEMSCASPSVFSVDSVTRPVRCFEQAILRLERLISAGNLEDHLQEEHTHQAILDEAPHASNDTGFGDDSLSASMLSQLCLGECDTFRWSGGLMDDPSGLVDLLPNLCHLTLRGQALTDVSPLLHLRRLESLNLAENHLTELPCLSELKALRELVLDFNELTDLPSTMGPLLALRVLSACGNQITQVDVSLFLNTSHLSDTLKSQSPRLTTPKLEALYLSYNCITDMNTIYALRDVSSLLILNVAGNPCASHHSTARQEEEEEVRLYLIHTFPQLRMLDGVSISAAEMTKAREAYAGKINSDLLTKRACGSPETWASLRSLNLSHCSLKEVTQLEPFVSLEVLHLQYNMLASARGVGMLTQLTALDLSHNRLGGAPWRNAVSSAANASSARGLATGPMTPPAALGDTLAHLRRLQSLSLEANQINDLSTLKLRFPHLKFLNVRGNELQHIQNGLGNLPELHELLLDQNKLRVLGIDSFLANTKLTILSAENNLLRSVEGLQQCRSLEQLRLGANRLGDLNILLNELQPCPLKVAMFVGNPVARKTNYRSTVMMRFSLLRELDRRAVTQEERDKALSARMTELAAPPNVVIDMNFLSGVGAGPAGSLVLPPQSGANLNTVSGTLVSGSAGLASRGRGGGGAPIGGISATQSPPQSQLASIRTSAPQNKRAVAADRFAVNQRSRLNRR